jgi:hypothetical protein
MNTTFLSWQSFEPNALRTIEIDNNELTLIYDNDSALDLQFADEEQLDRFGIDSSAISCYHWLTGNHRKRSDGTKRWRGDQRPG